jgi:hypothetical protein
LLVLWCVFDWRVGDLETFGSEHFKLHLLSLNINHQNYFQNSILELFLHFAIIEWGFLDQGFFPVWLDVQLSRQVDQICQSRAKSVQSFLETWMG